MEHLAAIVYMSIKQEVMPLMHRRSDIYIIHIFKKQVSSLDQGPNLDTKSFNLCRYDMLRDGIMHL